jgi:hypothetical protein
MDSLKVQKGQDKGPDQPLCDNTSLVKILPCKTNQIFFLFLRVK